MEVRSLGFCQCFSFTSIGELRETVQKLSGKQVRARETAHPCLSLCFHLTRAGEEDWTGLCHPHTYPRYHNRWEVYVDCRTARADKRLISFVTLSLGSLILLGNLLLHVRQKQHVRPRYLLLMESSSSGSFMAIEVEPLALLLPARWRMPTRQPCNYRALWSPLLSMQCSALLLLSSLCGHKSLVSQ